MRRVVSVRSLHLQWHRSLLLIRHVSMVPRGLVTGSSEYSDEVSDKGQVRFVVLNEEAAFASHRRPARKARNAWTAIPRDESHVIQEG